MEQSVEAGIVNEMARKTDWSHVAWPLQGMALRAVEGTGLMPEALSAIDRTQLTKGRKVVIGKV